MNGKKAKALRKAIGFKPETGRAYKGGASRPGVFGFGGAVTTQTAEGARRQYQAVKRRGMINHVLGAKHA
jgi:hypothetical protein